MNVDGPLVLLAGYGILLDGTDTTQVDLKPRGGIQRFKCGSSKSACSRIKSLRQIGTVFSFLFPLFLCPISGSHSGIGVLKHSGLFRKVRNKCYYSWQVYHHGTRGAILSSFVTCLQGL